MHTCDRPLAASVVAKASARPSGDQRGRYSEPGPVNGRGESAGPAAAPAPPAGASQIRRAYRLAARSGSVTVKATVAPSGDTRGSPAWRTAPMSAGVMPAGVMRAGASVTWLIWLLPGPGRCGGGRRPI
jgi:hypothetical protein